MQKEKNCLHLQLGLISLFLQMINCLKHFPFGLNPNRLILYLYCVSSGSFFLFRFFMLFTHSAFLVRAVTRCCIQVFLVLVQFVWPLALLVQSSSVCCFFLVAPRVNRCQGRRGPLLLHGGTDHTQTCTRNLKVLTLKQCPDFAKLSSKSSVGLYRDRDICTQNS